MIENRKEHLKWSDSNKSNRTFSSQPIKSLCEFVIFHSVMKQKKDQVFLSIKISIHKDCIKKKKSKPKPNKKQNKIFTDC